MREILVYYDDGDGLEVGGPEEDIVDSRGIGLLTAARCVQRLPGLCLRASSLVSLPKLWVAVAILAVHFFPLLSFSTEFVTCDKEHRMTGVMSH